MNQPSSQRILSIDVLRGLTIFLMIFVNDLAGVEAAPPWMKHFYPYDADGMTFVDVIFPAFLFIVGLSIPFALGKRLHRDGPLPAALHVLGRTAWLLLIGVFMVNSYAAAPEGKLLPGPIWTLLLYAGVIAVWNQPPREAGRGRTAALRARGVGVALLALLALVYDHADVQEGFEMRTMWWGILGLIGWAYLVAAMVYFLFRDRAELIALAVAALYCLYAADKVGSFDFFQPLRTWVDFGSMLGSHAAITTSGVLMGIMLSPRSPLQKHEERLAWAAGFAALLAIAGGLLYQLRDLHPQFIINKNAATIPWCLLSTALTVLVWMVIYLVIDVFGLKRWAGFLAPAGENPLFAYVLQPAIYAAFAALLLISPALEFWEKLGTGVWSGIIRSIAIAVFITWLVGFLKDRGVRMKV